MQSKNQNFVSGLSSVLPPAVSACCTSGDDYFSSSEYVSSSFSSAVRAPFVNQIVAGGKRIVLTAALAGMLNANLVQPALGQFTSIVSNSTVTSETISGAGAAQHVRQGGITSRNSVYAGGQQLVSSGGYARYTSVLSGGTQNVSSGGDAISTYILAGGVQNISNGVYVQTTRVSSGGIQNISGGRAYDTVIYGIQNVFSGGTAQQTYVSSGGTQNVSTGGIDLGARISNGGTQNVSTGGSVSAAYIYYGIQNVLAGAVVNSTSVNGGTQNVSNGGVVSYTSVSNSGAVNVLNGGRVSNAYVQNGGTMNVLSNGSALSTNINGGIMNISSGAYVSDISINNGTANVFNGALVSGIISVNTWGVLDGKVDSSLDTLNIISGGSWKNIISSIVTNLVFSDGTIDMRNGNSVGNNILTIQNLSASNNPVIEMNARLGDETSPADLVKVTGTYTGNTILRVHNVGGSGGTITAGSGIEIADASEATGNGTFALLGGKVDVGEYDYFLQQDAGIYRLVTFLGLTDLYKTMANAPLINVFTARSAMTNMEERLGDLRAFGYEQNKQGLWMRAYGKSATVKDLAETDITLFALEAGYDRVFNISENKLYAGITAGYMSVNDIKTKINKGSKGTGSIPSFGLYASLVGKNDFFADFTVKEIISNLEMTNYASDGTELNFEPKRNILALTLESGKLFKKELQGSYVRIEPKAGLLFMSADSGSAKVKNGLVGDLEYDAANYLTAKAGIVLGLVKTADGKAKIEPLIELAYLHELLGKDKIKYGAEEYDSDMSGGSVEVGAGLNAKLSEKIRLYGQISYETGEKIKATGVNVGAQYSF